MPKDSSYHDFVVDDLLKDIDGITSKAMFGGYGIYKDGYIFACIMDNELYLKVDESNIDDYKQADSEPFVYTKTPTGKPMSMGYWRLPEEISEDKDLLKVWVAKAVHVSMNSKTKPKKKK